ncbi:hypothetical protein TWF694_010085 [Orbilia ellipsospora]|uniref:Uncharacterized protein n=1 Tax=Orbilia ellipsospora TaxID=2528407 RepID=A0AAV9XF59_9PEZI
MPMVSKANDTEGFVTTKKHRITDKEIIQAYHTLMNNPSLLNANSSAQLALVAAESTKKVQTTIQVSVDETTDSNTECSLISDDDIFDPTRTIMTATRYVQHHIGMCFFRSKASLPASATTADVTLEEPEIDNLANQNGWPAWKTASVKHEGTMFELGGNKRLPLSLILPYPRRRRDSEVKKGNPEYFYTYIEGWKKDSIINNALILVEMIPGEPPECAVWEDGQEGALLNGTKWLSVVEHGKPLYIYDKAQIFKTHVARVWPNSIYPESKRCAKDFVLVLKHSNSEISGQTEKSCDKDFFVNHFGGKSKGQNDARDFLRDTLRDSNRYKPELSYDGASDESKWPSWLPKYQDWSEEDASKLLAFERSNGEGIRVIYVTRDPKTNERVPLVDYVREEDERYPFVQDMIEKGNEGGNAADSLTVDCPQVGLRELRDRLNMAYDHMEERLAYLEGQEEMVPKKTKQLAEKPTRCPSDKLATLLVGPKGPIPLDGTAEYSEGGSEYDSDIENVYEVKDWSTPIRIVRQAEQRTFASLAEAPALMREYIDASLKLAMEYEQKGREYDAGSINAAYVDYLGERENKPKDSCLKVKGKEKMEAEGVLIKGLPKCPPPPTDSSSSSNPSDSSSSEESLLDTAVPHLNVEILDGNYSPRFIDTNVMLDDGIDIEVCSVWGSSEESNMEGEHSKESSFEKYADSIIEERRAKLQRIISEQNKVNNSILLSIELLRKLGGSEYIRKLKLLTEAKTNQLIKGQAGADVSCSHILGSYVGQKPLSIINHEYQQYYYPNGVVTPDLKPFSVDPLSLGAVENAVCPVTRNPTDYAFSPYCFINESIFTVPSTEIIPDLSIDNSEDMLPYYKSQPPEKNHSLANVVVFEEWDAKLLEPKTITQIIFTSKVILNSEILDTIIHNKSLCQRLVYLEINNSEDDDVQGSSDIQDMKIRKLVQSCPGLVGIALRGVPSVTDDTMDAILSSSKFICGIEVSGCSHAHGTLTVKGLAPLKRPRIACNLRELVIMENPNLDCTEAEAIAKKYQPFLQLTHGTGGIAITYSAARNTCLQCDGRDIGRWMLLEDYMTDEQMEGLKMKEMKAVEENKSRYSVARIMEYSKAFGGFQFPLDEEQEHGAERIDRW